MIGDIAMTNEELFDLINQICSNKAEGQTIEVKASRYGCPKRLYDTLSGFSNQDSGGIIVFGINEQENFSLCGTYDVQDLQKKVTEQCNQMEPPVRAVFTYIEYNGMNICSAEIPGIDFTKRPCYYKGAGRLKGSYIRVGDADLPMTDYELYSFEAFRKHAHDDERVIERASMQSFDMEKLDAYIKRQQKDKPGFSRLPENIQEEMLNISRDGKPTLAAILNFCIYPQGYLPQMAITAVRVPGYEIGDVNQDDARFTDNKRIEGTLADMLDGALAFSIRNMKVSTIIDSSTGKRTDKTEYPVKAIREAVLNALIHRDYSPFTEGTPVQMIFFADRLEIHSPGNLYGRMTVEQLGYSKPDLRNPALALIAESQTEAENRYSGIPTIRLAMKEHGLPEPEFENRRNEFVVILRNSAIEAAGNESDSDNPGSSNSGGSDAFDGFNSPGTENFNSGETDFTDTGANTLIEFCRMPRTRREIADYLELKTIYHVTKAYIEPLLESGDLIMTNPSHPKSKNQKFVSGHRK